MNFGLSEEPVSAERFAKEHPALMGAIGVAVRKELEAHDANSLRSLEDELKGVHKDLSSVISTTWTILGFVLFILAHVQDNLATNVLGWGALIFALVLCVRSLVGCFPSSRRRS